MKKLGIWWLASLLCLGLCACGGEKGPFDPEKTTQALLDAPGAFSEKLEEIEEPILLRLYGFEGELVPTRAKGYGSTGATAEEASVFVFADETAAQEAMAVLETHLELQKEANETYRPQEMPKLDKAVAERRGNTLLFLVADDYAAAQAALG